MEVCKKNWTKVRALYALRLRKLAGAEWAGAGEISELAGLSPDSLYVLLSRWRRWKLVKCNRFSTPYEYALACHGTHYLQQLGAWYSQQRLAYEAVCDISRPSLYWCSLERHTGQVAAVHFLTYPFRTAADYQLVTPNAAGRFIYTGESQIRIEKGSALQAVYGIRDDLQLTWGNELIDLLVTKDFIRRKEGG